MWSKYTYVYLIHLPIYKSDKIIVPNNVYKLGYTSRTIGERIIEHIGGYEQYKKYEEKIKRVHIESFNYMALKETQTTEEKCIYKFKKCFKKWDYGKEWFIIDDIYKAINIIKCERWHAEKKFSFHLRVPVPALWSAEVLEERRKERERGMLTEPPIRVTLMAELDDKFQPRPILMLKFVRKHH